MVLLATFLQAGVHLFDRSRIDHVSGVWIVLADAVTRDGVSGGLYPPLRSEDGQQIGGTRYMPLGVLATAATSIVTGDTLAAGKLVSFAGAIAVCGALVLLLRQARVPWWAVLGLLGVTIGAEPGQIATLTARQEAWPLALQLMALWLGLRSTSTAVLVVAAALSVAAFLFKLTAVWAPVALGLSWLLHNRRAWFIYCASYFILLALALGLLHIATDGRMLETLTGLGGAGLHSAGGVLDRVLSPLSRLAAAITHDAPSLWALAGISIGSLALRGHSPLQPTVAIAWAVSLLILCVLFGDIGIASNHLIDFAALSALLASRFALAGTPQSPEPADSIPNHFGELAVAGVLVWSLAAILVLSQARMTLIALKQAARGGTPEPWASATPFAGEFDSASRLFFEDPSLWLTINQRPEFTDPFMLPTLLARHPEWAEPIVSKLTAREYAAVVLIRPIEAEPMHFERVHLGPAIAQAIRGHYQFDRMDSAGRYIYKPKADAQQTTP
jgi:hypothetical protein